ncbi:MAG: hypothetical protein U0984_11185 [Prosthecobacter sp.]|nr:hypothetical protein [Prosthecobacter sp.]
MSDANSDSRPVSILARLWKELRDGYLRLIFFLAGSILCALFFIGTFMWNHHVFVIHKVEPALDRIPRIETAVSDTQRETKSIGQRISEISTDLDKRILSGKFPSHGIIAEFASAPGDKVLTNQGEELSLLSDSVRGYASTIHFELIPYEIGNSDGFLKIHYDLLPKNRGPQSFVPYVGVYANFSNPVISFDVTQFKGVEIKLRPTKAQPGDRFYLALCDASVTGNGNYAWAECEIPRGVLSDTAFVLVKKRFDDFKTPRWGGGPFEFDAKRVFRFIIKIEGQVGVASDGGELDIEDLRFF